MIIEAKKSYNLPSGTWRPRKTGGIIPVQTRRTVNQGSQWCKFRSESKCQRTRSVNVWGKELEVPAQAQSKFALPASFYSIQALKGLDDSHLHWWGQSLHLLIQMLLSSGNSLTNTTRNDLLPVTWVVLSPVKLTHKLNHHKNEIITDHNRASKSNI